MAQVQFPPKEIKGVWAGVVAVLVAAALGYWWYTSGLPLSTWLGFGGEAPLVVSTSTPTAEVPSARPVASATARTSETDVVSIVTSLPSVSTFRSLLSSTGVGATINARSVSPYTILVPTDGAIAQLPRGSIQGLSPADKRRLVQNHVIAGRAVDADALVSGQMVSLSGDTLNFSYGSNGIALVGSAIIIAKYEGTNGVVYVIDGVLLPPTRAQ
jgi:uncharacterized surface protein with fasciclin (FAS1) repeats